MNSMNTIALPRLSGILVVGGICTGLLLGAQTRAIYPQGTSAPGEIATALAKAAHLHKKVILDFGGNWCGDCRALDALFHKEPNASLLKSGFILVDINIGKMDQNLAIAKKYEVPLNKGVPALAVLDSEGHLVYSQKNGEFEAMRSMDPASVTQFLNHWK
jgi:thiol-disulfide isomerase/thioredoxin